MALNIHLWIVSRCFPTTADLSVCTSHLLSALGRKILCKLCLEDELSFVNQTCELFEQLAVIGCLVLLLVVSGSLCFSSLSL